MAETNVQLMRFDDLFGWAEDDHQAALDTFRMTCQDFDDPDWNTLCDIAATQQNPRDFFELFFKPVLISDGEAGLFTGYFEPELQGARRPDERYRFPIYRLPAEARSGPWLTRRQIEETGALQGRGLEIAWVDDSVEAFFLQIQGSGRIRMNDGSVVRVGYGGKNGRNYSSVGAELVRRGIYEPHQVSAQVIQSWVRNNPVAGRELLWVNDSYVFFREVSEVPADRGPLGAMNRSITEMRSIAVDPEYTPLGAPVWIEKEGATPLRRLMIAQDTGSAIKGAQRADIFYGTGDQAGRLAGRIRDGGRMIVLLPIQRAYAMLPEGLE
ncbi:murein transglycosylase A [Aestuariibius sp. HNIBRBA575]|uniref:murein transglycosylase A n=1 Tax=Aestuariibius sp. HNIBRBA575 TaxID=3233343 RepID=UPI0034A1C73E